MMFPAPPAALIARTRGAVSAMPASAAFAIPGLRMAAVYPC